MKLVPWKIGFPSSIPVIRVGNAYARKSMSERAEKYPRERESRDRHGDIQSVNDNAGDELFRHCFLPGTECTERVKHDEHGRACADRSRYRDGDSREETSVSAFEEKKYQYCKSGRD